VCRRVPRALYRAPPFGGRRGHRWRGLLCALLLRLLLLRWLSRAHGRLFGEDALQDGQEVEQGRLVPVLVPLRQVRMVDAAVAAHVLARAHHHVLRWRYVNHGRRSRVAVGHPDGYREAVCCAAKRDGQRPAEQQQEGGGAILVC
jgi:hypothetical protein